MRSVLSLFLLVVGASFLAAADKPKAQNELISDFIDDTDKYKGKTLTFRLTYGTEETILPLRQRVGDKKVPFVGKDPKNGAKLVLVVEIPKDLKLPAAKFDEEVIITFDCKEGVRNKGNVAVSITRP